MVIMTNQISSAEPPLNEINAKPWTKKVLTKLNTLNLGTSYICFVFWLFVFVVFVQWHCSFVLSFKMMAIWKIKFTYSNANNQFYKQFMRLVSYLYDRYIQLKIKWGTEWQLQQSTSQFDYIFQGTVSMRIQKLRLKLSFESSTCG